MNRIERINNALTSIHHEVVYHSQEECPKDLLAALGQAFTHIEPLSWSERLAFGGVYLNGVRCEHNTNLTIPCRVEYFEPKFPIAEAKHAFPSFSDKYILYEDDDLVAVFKPRGLPSTPNREQSSYHLKQYLEDYYHCSVHLPSRLDTSTKGVMMVSRSERMHGRLQRLYERRLVKKEYLLEVPVRFDWETNEIEAPIARSALHPVLREVNSERGKPAKTHFERFREQSFVDRDGTTHDSTLLLAKPVSGRTHQLRVHCQEFGPSIIGDNFYEGLFADELHLLSYRVSLWHPFFDREMSVSVPDNLLPEWIPSEKMPTP
ncbi:MAG: RluA family pseudouridine synthase [Bdellovibrionales bacterium]|nr:RluA family pseudouridine synthase [Bdellovibrionales bacterium]